MTASIAPVGAGVEESREDVTLQLAEARIGEFHKQGYLFLPEQFTAEEIAHWDFTPIKPLEDDCLPDPAEQEGAPPALGQR